MRRILLLILCMALLFSVSLVVAGANDASKFQYSATVHTDKSCSVTIVATLHIEDSSQRMYFPIPPDAEDATLNGVRVKPEKDARYQQIDLSQTLQNMTGDFTVTVGYTLPNVIGTDEAGNPEMQLPLLCGFTGSIDTLDFTVLLPGEPDRLAAFSSGYHNADIEKYLSCTNNGNTVTGCSLDELKDRETLTMYLPVQESWFPDAPLAFFESSADDIAMLLCAILAVVYWLVFLRCRPVKRRTCTSGPEGFTAGQIGSLMTLGKSELSLMVFTWAQLGYLQIQMLSRKVILHKQMDMGNERSDFEQHCFHKLFAKNDKVDTSGLHYATHCRKVEKMAPKIAFAVKKSAGNPRLFRAIAALTCLFGGVSFGISITQDAVVQGFGVFMTASAGLFCGWFMQSLVRELFLRKTGSTALSLLFAVLWLLMGLLAGQLLLAMVLLAAMLFFGLMAFFGGQRTEEGMYMLDQLLGLRHFMRTASRDTLRRMQAADPDYFHNMAPYALAFGVCRSFAARYGKTRVPECHYLTTKRNVHTPQQWCEVMKTALSMMNQRSRKLPFERFAAFFSAVRQPEEKRKKPE